MKFFVRFSVALFAVTTFAADQPQFGHAWTRNMVSAERGLPEAFDPKTGKNIQWTARLGSESYATAVVAGGRVYLGANNAEPRDPKHVGDRGVMMCFDEKDGHLLWQLVVPKREEDIYHDWPKTGMSSPVTVEGERVYMVNNRGVVMCLDARGMANGNDGPFRDEGRLMTPIGTNAPPQPLASGPLDADVLWLFDLTKDAGIWSHDGAHSSILIHGDYLYLNTGTGVDNTHRKIRTPDAPSLVVLDKRTGRLVARDHEHMAPRIFHCTWSSPSLAKVDGREMIFFAGGNGIVYAFEPLTKAADGVQTLKKIWQFNFDPDAPADEVHRYTSNRATGPSNIYGMPVFHEGSLYVAGGGDWFWGKNEAWLKCLDPRGSGELTTNAVRWVYPLGRHTMATPAVHDGLVFVTDAMRMLHCVDAKSGRAVWTHELGGEIWASALIADGKVFIGTRRGDFWVFAASREKQVLSRTEFGAGIAGTAVAANGVLYVSTAKNLYAIRRKAE